MFNGLALKNPNRSRASAATVTLSESGTISTNRLKRVFWLGERPMLQRGQNRA